MQMATSLQLQIRIETATGTTIAHEVYPPPDDLEKALMQAGKEIEISIMGREYIGRAYQLSLSNGLYEDRKMVVDLHLRPKHSW